MSNFYHQQRIYLQRNLSRAKSNIPIYQPIEWTNKRMHKRNTRATIIQTKTASKPQVLQKIIFPLVALNLITFREKLNSNFPNNLFEQFLFSFGMIGITNSISVPPEVIHDKTKYQPALIIFHLSTPLTLYYKMVVTIIIIIINSNTMIWKSSVIKNPKYNNCLGFLEAKDEKQPLKV
jgi:hypothetical protein